MCFVSRIIRLLSGKKICESHGKIIEKMKCHPLSSMSYYQNIKGTMMSKKQIIECMKLSIADPTRMSKQPQTEQHLFSKFQEDQTL